MKLWLTISNSVTIAQMIRKMVFHLEDIFKGYNHEIEYTIDKRCPNCNGTGGTGIETCTYCHGTGQFMKVEKKIN